jgi:4-hydroxymandelate oxidase
MQQLPPDALCLDDYARLACEVMAEPVWAWLDGGSGGLQARKADGFARHAIYNRVLRQAGHVSCAAHILGQELIMPVMLAPVGYHRLVHEQGEIATARGAFDSLMVVSTMASVPMEDIARAAAGPLWFQLYIQAEREDTLRLVRRAVAAGFRAIMVTLDTPVQPASHAAIKAGFAMPAGVQAVHLRSGGGTFAQLLARAPGVEDLAWLREVCPLPLLAKGITHPDEAAALIAMGFDGIVVSNHGGRALECAPAPIDALPAIRRAVGPKACVLMDGGVRGGADVFKAIALGADAVMLGRAQMHGLAVGGSLGVAHVLKLVREELELVMALAGAATLADIGPDTLFSAGEIRADHR